MSVVSFEPITPAIGAYVHVSPDHVLDAGVPDQILDAMNRFMVLVFPEVQMSDDTYIALCAAMGETHGLGVTDDASDAANTGVYRIALDKDDPTQLDFVRGNNWWHMDGTVYAVPGKSTMLKCESAPKTGGDTGFANLFAAWDALPDDRKQQLKQYEVIHCMASVGRKMYDAPTDADFARWDAVFPDTPQPLVWRHRDGRTSMVIGSTADRITQLPLDEGRALLAELTEWVTQDRFAYRHIWKRGDLVMFNNPGLLHRSYPYDESAGRLMHRMTLKGSEPIVAA